MKNKIISIIILVIMCLQLLMINYHVKAYEGEIDPKNYINLPSLIAMKDNLGIGTIAISEEAEDYEIFYQKIDINEEQLKALQNINNQATKYQSEQNDIKTQKEAELTELNNKYTKLLSDPEATEEEIEIAENDYKIAYAEYEEFLNNVNTEMEKLQAEYYNLIPDYNDEWQATSNSEDNVQIDFNGASNIVSFVLWVKISNGIEEYYDAGYYSLKLSEDDKQDQAEWTDFTRGNFTLVKHGISDAIIEIAGVQENRNSVYYIYISDNANKPNIMEIPDDEKIYIYYDEQNNKFIANNEKIAAKVELNQELYVSIIEQNILEGINDIVTYGNRLERFGEARYNDAFHSTFMTYESSQIITTFTHSQENNRKMEIKIGKITDKSILTKLKNKDSSAFSELMNFAKSSDYIYNDMIDADKDDSFAIEYNAGEGTENSVIQVDGIEDNEYYYLYVKTDDENGKYISNEAVTLTQGSINKNGEWYMFFYGSSNFKWNNEEQLNQETIQLFNGEEPKNSTTTILDKLPKTGLSYILLIMIIIFTIICIIAKIKYKKYKKYNF